MSVARVDQFKIRKPKLLLVNTHGPCQNAVVKLQRVKFSVDLVHSNIFWYQPLQCKRVCVFALGFEEV